MSQTNATIESERRIGHAEKVIKWLNAPDPSINFNNARARCQPGTGLWLLNHSSFLQWKIGKRKVLWLHGIPGCGKTILSSTIIDHLRHDQASAIQPILSFFFDFNDPGKQSTEDLLRSFVSQLYLISERCWIMVYALYSKCQDMSSRQTVETLSKTFEKMIKLTTGTYIVIDALDECKTRQDVLRWMKAIAASNSDNLHIIITSRREVDLESGIRSFVDEENFMLLQQRSVDPDICCYVRATLRSETGGFNRWHKSASMLQEIETTLTLKASGM